VTFSFFGTEAYIPLGATELRGATPTQAGLALTFAALGWIAATWTQDQVEARRGPGSRALRVRLGFLLLALGITVAGAGLCTGPVLPALVIPAGWCVAGFGIGLAYSAGTLLCIGAAPAGHEGEVSAQLDLLESLGVAAGAGLGGALLALVLAQGGSPAKAEASVFVLMLAVALAGQLAAARLAPASPAVSRS
jgi:hypothetical protein